MFGFAPKVEPANVALVGIRDLDEIERDNVRDTGVRAFTMRDIDERGMRAVMDEAIAIATNGTAGFHLSLDMDFVDPEYAPGVGTPVRGGATYREAHLAMEMVVRFRAHAVDGGGRSEPGDRRSRTAPPIWPWN